MKRLPHLLLLACVLAPDAGAQTIVQRGFAEGAATLFPQRAAQDATRLVTDLRLRDELFYKPAAWLQFAAGLDVRANSHDQVEDAWRLDYADRGGRRPRLSVRRLTTTLTRAWLTIDAGKQFVRWGKTDIVTPTDRFAPRDFLNVIDSEFLAVTAVRGVAQIGRDSLEGVWVPRLTPSRTPLLDQRWSGGPADATLVAVVDGGAVVPSGRQVGVRWSHVGDAMEYSLSYVVGFNHLPVIVTAVVTMPPGPPGPPGPPAVAVTRTYPSIQAYGADFAAPTPWLTIKAEAAYINASSSSAGMPANDDYVLYVIQLERQTGEWTLVGGYAGEAVTRAGATVTFSPDRGLSRAFVGRASYTLDSNRTVAFEGAVRQRGQGVYARAEYSQAYGQHWRATLAGVAIRGERTDFLGQYRRNSNASATLRYSF